MKKIISLILCILTVAAFGGCGNDEPSAQKDMKADMFTLSQEMMKADETLPIMMIHTDKEDTDGSKLKKLGWSAAYDIKEGTRRTIDILRSLQPE